MIIEKLRTHVEAMPENSSPNFELRMSSSGECVRLLDYNCQMGPGSIEFRSFIRMELGHAAHNLLHKVVSDALSDDFYGAEEECSFSLPTYGYTVKGHPDGRIRSLKATFELKSVSDNTFRMIKGQNIPLDQHIAQGNTYACTLGDENVLILYLNRDTGEMEEFLFPVDVALYHSVKDKFGGVLRRHAAKEIAPRPYTDATAAPCYYCPHVKTCYADFKEEIAVMKTAKVTAPDVLHNVRSAITNRNIRLVSEKIEEAMKKAVAKDIHGMGLNFAHISSTEEGPHEATVSLSVGKNDNLLIQIKEVKK